MIEQKRVVPGSYAAHLHLDNVESIHAVAERNPQQYAGTLPEDVFAFYYFDVEEDGVLHEDLDRANHSKQYFVDAELFGYDDAVNLPGITEFALERMQTLKTSAMRYASGRRIRFYNPDWQEIINRR